MEGFRSRCGIPDAINRSLLIKLCLKNKHSSNEREIYAACEVRRPDFVDSNG